MGKPDLNELIVFFWYMSCWKTEFCYYMARENAQIGNKVWFISIELDEYNLKLRIARKRACIDKNMFQNQTYTDTQRILMKDEFEKIDKMKDIFIVNPINDTNHIIDEIRRLYDQWCRLFVIDNLDKISGVENDNARYQYITSSLQNLKNELPICIILIHHAKKPLNKIQSYSPAGMSWLRGSQKIMDNATQVIEIWRDLDPDIIQEEKDRVVLYQYKDTFEWWNGKVTIYFSKWDYYGERQNELPF